jgi:hypothetical protein
MADEAQRHASAMRDSKSGQTQTTSKQTNIGRARLAIRSSFISEAWDCYKDKWENNFLAMFLQLV